MSGNPPDPISVVPSAMNLGDLEFRLTFASLPGGSRTGSEVNILTNNKVTAGEELTGIGTSTVVRTPSVTGVNKFGKPRLDHGRPLQERICKSLGQNENKS